MSLSFYTVETEYCDFLRYVDTRVPINSDAKSGRPFVGVVLQINGYSYFAPLTSPKPKHLHMKNQVDFIKINGGKWGAINLNNMIPVCSECLHKINMSPMPNDSAQEKNYKSLLSNQLSWCNSHRNHILDRANKLYTLITDGKVRDDLKARCCDFHLVEARSREYSEREEKTDSNTKSSDNVATFSSTPSVKDKLHGFDAERKIKRELNRQPSKKKER